MHLRSRGFSLMEIIISGGILAVISLAIAGLMSYYGKESRSVDASSQLNDFRKNVAERFANTDLCNDTLQNLAFNGSPQIPVKSPLFPDGTADSGDVLGGVVTLTSITFQNPRLEVASTGPGVPAVYSARVNFALERASGLSGGPGLQPFYVNVFFKSSNGTTINPDGCIGLTPPEKVACVKVNGIWHEATSAEPGKCDVCTQFGGIYDYNTGTCDLCTARGGTYNMEDGTCDMCPAVGATKNAAGVCIVAAASPPPIVVPPASPPPSGPPAPVPTPPTPGPTPPVASGNAICVAMWNLGSGANGGAFMCNCGSELTSLANPPLPGVTSANAFGGAYGTTNMCNFNTTISQSIRDYYASGGFTNFVSQCREWRFNHASCP